MGNIRRWCISRQLWRGHRILAFELKFDSIGMIGKQTGSWLGHKKRLKLRLMERIKSKYGDKAGSIKYRLEQDKDVLDTWLSAFIPFQFDGMAR